MYLVTITAWPSINQHQNYYANNSMVQVQILMSLLQQMNFKMNFKINIYSPPLFHLFNCSKISLTSSSENLVEINWSNGRIIILFVTTSRGLNIDMPILLTTANACTILVWSFLFLFLIRYHCLKCRFLYHFRHSYLFLKLPFTLNNPHSQYRRSQAWRMQKYDGIWSSKP